MNTLLENFYDNHVFKGVKNEHGEVDEVTFIDCSFNNCSFTETIFRACKFQGCAFTKCDLNLIKVDNSTFTNTTFENSKIVGVNWVKASWGERGMHQLLKSIDFTNCVLNYSTFMGLNLEKVLIKKCTARDVDFSEANLKQADCSFTDFTNTKFRHTDLTETNFRGATNYFIQPQLNTLKKTRFSLPEAISLLYNLDIEIGEAFDEENEENKDTQ